MTISQQPLIVLPLAAVAGAVMGSHLATVALRWPQGRSAATGRSCCDGCGRTLQAYELVPILSWIALRGRCARCGGRIDPRHPATEAAGAVLALLMAATLPPAAAVAGMGLAWTLLLLTVLDIDHYWLPDRVTVPLLAGGLAVAALGIGPGLPERAAGAAAGWGGLAAVGWGYARLRGRRGLGGGDPKLLGAIGAWLGWRMLPATLLVASLSGLALVIVAAAAGRAMGRYDRMPFGPMLAVAGVAGWIRVAGGG